MRAQRAERPRRAIFAIAGVIAMLATTPVHASHPTMLSFEVFGDVDVRTDPVKGRQLHAWGAPFGRGVTAPGLAWVRGRSGSGGAFVDIVVDDDRPETAPIATTVVAEPARTWDGSANPDAGNFFTSVIVTDLGAHAATGDPSAGDGGATLLTFTATSRFASGARSAPLQATLTKYAGSRYDTFHPQFMTRRGEPDSDTGYTVVGGDLWCHRLPKQPVFGNFGFNAFSTPLHEGVRQFEELLGQQQEDPRDPRRWDSYWSGCSDESTVPVRGFSANVTDERDETVSFGIASEIGEVEVTVTGGPLTSPRRIHPAIVRSGTGASISVTLRIEDFEPTYYIGGPQKHAGVVPDWARLTGQTDEIDAPPYEIHVRFEDAWGNGFDWSPMTFDVCKC